MDSNTSLDKLAHIANMSRELHELNRQIKEEKTPEFGDRDYSGNEDKNDYRLDSALKNKRLACTWCRQQKSKCDARDKYPDACSQCQKKGRSCELKPEFKRTQKRARIALIEKEFADLKRLFMSPLSAAELLKMAPFLSAEGTPFSASPQPVPAPLPPNSPFERLAASNSPAPPPLDPPTRPFVRVASAEPANVAIPDVALLCEEKSLESVTLDPETIRHLYMEYARHYHPILPVVDLAKGPERIYRLCPALFWVIMFVALRRYDESKSLLLQLSPLIKNILAEITISPITRYNPTEEDEPIMNASSVYSVQAFILYTLWPPLTSSLSADSSWNTIGVALFQAIRIGLHSSSLILEEDQLKQRASLQNQIAQEHLKTWIVCNIVAQNIATAFGFPAFVQFDSLRAQFADIPTATRHNMEIAHFEDQVAKTLNTTFSESSSGVISEKLPLVKVLLRQLDELEMKLSLESADDTGYRKFLCIVARIHLLTQYFLEAPKLPLFELSMGLVRLYNAAISLIHHTEWCQERNKDFMKYLPVVSILNIWQASCIIVKLANSPLKTVLDVDSGKQIYLNAISLVAKASILKHDIAYRASGIMRNMWQLFRTLDEKGMTSLSIKITSRRAASVFFDCLSLLRDQVGMAKLNIRTDVRDNSVEDENEEGGSYEGINNSGDDAVESSDDEIRPVDPDSSEHRSVGSTSQKSTPGSTNSGKIRKKRSLSGLEDAESKARKIIRTIPLDPQPISASKRSSIFKIVNTSTDTLPSVANDTEDSRGVVSPNSVKIASGMRPPTRHHGNVKFASAQGAQNDPNSFSPMVSQGSKGSEVFIDYNESPSQGVVHNLELDIFDTNNDSLWKDVDSLMNDFGFHT